MNELKIIAKIVVKKEFQKELEEVLKKTVDASRLEEGNISYDLHQNINNHLEYIIIEVWKSESAISYHNQTSHFLEFKKSIENKIDLVNIDILQITY